MYFLGCQVTCTYKFTKIIVYITFSPQVMKYVQTVGPGC